MKKSTIKKLKEAKRNKLKENDLRIADDIKDSLETAMDAVKHYKRTGKSYELEGIKTVLQGIIKSIDNKI